MKRGISEILKVVNKEGQILNISVVQKQSDLGITYNKRLFVLVEDHYFAYISHFQDDEDPNNIDLSKCKLPIVPIKNVLKEERNKEILSLSFFYIENRKKINKKWVFKFSTQNLAMLWQRIFMNEMNKSTQRKSLSKSRASDSSSPFKNQLVNQNSQIKPNLLPSKISSQVVDNNRIKQSLKREFSIEKKMNQPVKQQKMYHNELYESERNKSKDSNMILNDSGFKNDPTKKLTYEQEELATQKKLHEEKKKQQMQKLDKQREQLQRKSQQLQAKERRLKNEELKLEQSKKMAIQQKQREFRKQLARKQSQNEQGQKEKERQKQISNLKSDLSFKPKTKEIKNYDEVVNRVIYGSPTETLKNSKTKSPKSQQLEETHDYLFQLQKLKMNNNKAHDKKSVENSPQAQKLSEVTYQLGWTFKYFVQQANGKQYDVICEFGEYCAKMLQQVTSEFHLSDRKKKYLPKYRRQQYYLYEKDDIQFKVAFIGLKDAINQSHQKTKDQICDQKNIKKLQIEFKNYQSIYKAIKQTKAKVLRVPLTCICQFQGFVALFKATTKFDGSANVGSEQKISYDLEKISTKMKINISSFKSKDFSLIMKVHNEYYRQLAAQTGRMYMKFEFFMIQEIKELMPFDLLFQKQAGQSVRVGNEKIYCLREQLIGKYKQSNDLISENISASLNRYEKVKGSRVVGNESENILEKLSQNILVPLSALIKELDCLQTYFIHPLEISNKLHEMGINMRYLGSIYENCTLKFSKVCILTQIAARTCKALFRKTIQDITIEQENEIVNLPSNENICFKVIDFFNCVLGNTVETKAVWELLSSHSQDYFNVSLNLQQIHRGYFLSSVIYHCGLDVVWTRINPQLVFQVNQFFNEENFAGLKVRVKNFQPVLTEGQISLFTLIQNQDTSAFKILENDYKIQTGLLPSIFFHEKYLNPLRKYISNFISPEMASSKGYANYSLYNQVSIPTKIQFSLKFMELKWYLKKQKKEKYVAKFSSLNEQITSTFGDFHPLLSELYDSMSLYHRNNGEFEDAITFSKSSVINMLKICGTNHQKVGECYYQLAVCCIKAGKKDEAIISLQKAKNIFEINEKQEDVAYSYVCLKLGLLFLSQGKSNEAENIVKFALSTFNKFLYENLQKSEDFLYQEQRVECYEILSRCFELSQDKEGQINLSVECQKQMRYINVPSNLQKILKVILCPILGSLSSSNAEIFLNVIQLIPAEMNINSYLKAHSRIHQRIQEGTLIENIGSYLENIESIEKFIKQSNSLDDWRGFEEVHERETVNDFLSLCEELIYFLGEGYVTGTIRDSL